MLDELEGMGEVREQVKELDQTRPEMSDLHVGHQVYAWSVARLLLFTATLENHVF